MIYNVYIPVPSENRELSRFVEQSVSEQSLDTNIVICHSHGEFNSQGIYTPLRCTGEAASRNLCRDAAIASGAEIVFKIDKDMALGRETRDGFIVSKNLLANLLAPMLENPLVGMVGCKRICRGGAVDIGVCAWRVAAMPHFEAMENCCMCPWINDQVKKAGYEIVFINNQIFTEV
jgi:hypothetical protein